MIDDENPVIFCPRVLNQELITNAYNYVEMTRIER
jgi:hypothetical protein